MRKFPIKMFNQNNKQYKLRNNIIKINNNLLKNNLFIKINKSKILIKFNF